MSYRGILGAVPFAIRESDSWVFRAYAVVGSLTALLVAVLVGTALVVLVAATAGVAGGMLTLSRAFFVVVGLLVVAPLVAPVLFVARRHRLDRTVDSRYDLALGVAGFGFLLALYAGLLATVPPAQQTPPTGLFAPVVRFLYGLPPLVGLVPPTVAALLIYGVHRWFGKGL